MGCCRRRRFCRDTKMIAIINFISVKRKKTIFVEPTIKNQQDFQLTPAHSEKKQKKPNVWVINMVVSVVI
jgi:hypothetical protein